jgi:telomerase Cajal body protein 1
MAALFKEQIRKRRPAFDLGMDCAAVTPERVFGRPDEGRFLKGCKWSPDGSCLLAASDNNCLTLFNLPDSLCDGTSDAANGPRRGEPVDLNDVMTVSEGETIYDYAWYPFMSSLDRATCCIASTSRDHPVHIWDAFSGELRCTYPLVTTTFMK